MNKTRTVRDKIQEYYNFRGLKTPSALEALLFLMSEIGEMAEAWYTDNQDATDSMSEHWAIVEIADLGRKCDELVSQRGGWVRNNGRAGEADLDGEIGDVLMMLDRFAFSAKRPEPADLLYVKMRRKGFEDV